MNNYKEVVIICYENKNLIYNPSTLYIGVEKGALFLLKNNFKNIIAISDFDSVSNDELNYIKNNAKLFFKTNSDKSKLDAEIAIEYAIEKKFKKISLYLTNNNRIDMLFASIFFANKYNIDIYIDDNLVLPLKLNTTLLIDYGTYNKYRYISLIAIKKSELNISKMKYNAANLELEPFSGNAISNELIKNTNGEITLLSGSAVITFIK